MISSPDWLWIAVIVAVLTMVGVGIFMSFLPAQRPPVPDLVRKPILSTQMDDWWPSQSKIARPRANGRVWLR